jgi:hypothetical protein
MSINKLIVLGAAFMLALLIGSTPAAAAPNPLCDPILYPSDDCDGDGILNSVDTCDNLDPEADCDNDGVPNGVDECPLTVEASTFSFGNTTCNISGLDAVLPSGCSLAESLEASLDGCDDNPGNHGKFVSCVAQATNMLKKQKVISGAQKGQIQSCAARSDIGKKPKPPKP